MPMLEPEWVKPWKLVGLQQGLRLARAAVGVLGGHCPASVRFCSEEVSEAKSLRALLPRAYPDPVSPGVEQPQKKVLDPLSSLPFPDAIRHGWQISSLAPSEGMAS